MHAKIFIDLAAENKRCYSLGIYIFDGKQNIIRRNRIIDDQTIPRADKQCAEYSNIF